MIHRMVTEIRDFTQSRNRDLTLDTVDLEDVVGQAINLLHYDKDVKNVHLDLVSGPGILARVHRGKIQQVVINLVKNAAQAIPREKDGTVVVTVIARAGRAWIQVSDDGEGIREEILEKIWQPFFSTKGDRGTGLGLDVCRQIVEAHQGTMEVHSRCGEGTTFQVALPLVSLDEPADPTAPPLAV
jgi:signal transduction histidine kinase